MAQHQENWGGFPSEIEDVPALVSTDLGWADEGPDPRRGMLIRVRVSVPELDEDEGLGPFLSSIEPFDDAMNAALPKQLNAVAVGLAISNKSRWWFFYASRSDGAQEIIARAAAKTKDLAPEVFVQDDPEWEFYGECLFPNEEQQRYMGDTAVVMKLQESGDDAEIERPIEHLAVFPDTESRDRFVDWCAVNGFEVTDATGEPEEEGDGYTVEFTHEGRTIVDEVFERTCAATQGAAECGGEYDGWQTAVMKKDD